MIGVNAVDYCGYPDCRPEFIAAFERLRDLATKRGVEGQAIAIDAPLVALTKAEIIRRGLELGVDYSLTVSCYQADDAGPRVRPLRRVPAAARGLRGGGRRGSDALPAARVTAIAQLGRQSRCISRNVYDADHVIITNPVSDSMPARNRMAPTGTTSPKPTVAYGDRREVDEVGKLRCRQAHEGAEIRIPHESEVAHAEQPDLGNVRQEDDEHQQQHAAPTQVTELREKPITEVEDLVMESHAEARDDDGG